MMKKILIAENGVMLDYDENTTNWYYDTTPGSVAIVVHENGSLDAYRIAGHGEASERFMTFGYASAIAVLPEVNHD